MNWKLIAAVIVGLITGVLLYFWTESVKNEQVAYAFMRLQPDRKVTRGQAITPDMLAEPVMLPESFGALAKLAVPAASAYQEWLKDRTAAADIPAGSVLLFQYFDDTDGGRLTTMIAPGKRALTLPSTPPRLSAISSSRAAMSISSARSTNQSSPWRRPQQPSREPCQVSLPSRARRRPQPDSRRLQPSRSRRSSRC